MSLKWFTFVEKAPHLPGGEVRHTARAPSYSEARDQMIQRGFDVGPYLPNGETLVGRGKLIDEGKTEDAVRDRDARKLKKLQQQQSVGA